MLAGSGVNDMSQAPLPVPPELEKLTGAVRTVLEEVGEDPTREGLARTPARVAKAFRFLTSGYRADIPALINEAVFEQSYDEMVIVKDIEVYSLCEHHMLPFHGRCHVGYLPNGRIIGLSKIPRLVDAFARRLQVQERLTQQIAECLQDALQPRGVGVVMDCVHLCMAMRGVEKQSSRAITSAMLGGFRTERACRGEFMTLIGQR
jgi:GTP cyclohydrolase I